MLQHWKNSVYCQFDAMFWNPTDWNENCRLYFSQNWILFVVTSSIYWEFVKDSCWARVLPARTCLVQSVGLCQSQGHNHTGERRGQPQCCSLTAAWALPVVNIFIYPPFLSENWKPHCSFSSRNSYKFIGSQRTPMLGRQGRNTYWQKGFLLTQVLHWKLRKLDCCHICSLQTACLM